MTVPSIQFEAKLMGYAKSRNKDGDWTDIRLQVHPEETEDLNRLMLGTRLQCVIVVIDDQEQPVAVQKPKGGELAKMAGILCSDRRFHIWAYQQDAPPDEPVFEEDPIRLTEASAIGWLREKCGVASRAELDHNPEAAQKFINLKAEFEQAHGMMAERH